MYDIIGDVHGHADELKSLLAKLGYIEHKGTFRHPDKTVVFLGDIVDRGKQVAESLDIVYRMVQEGSAQMVLGNHEYNILCYHTTNKKGGFLRKHTEKNTRQIKETLAAFSGHSRKWKMYIDWFKTLPLYLENDHFRAIHAAWLPDEIAYVRSVFPENRLTDELLFQSSQAGTKPFVAIEYLLKGVEIALTPDLYYKDNDGELRKNLRVRWWDLLPEHTLSDLGMSFSGKLLDIPVGENLPFVFKYSDEKPVFFGHYWLTGIPSLYSPYICCLDYSIAKGDKLVAYTWKGEKELTNNHFVWV